MLDEHKRAKKAFSEKYFYFKELLKAKKFLTAITELERAEKRWKISKSYVDKKGYNGAKKAVLSHYINLNSFKINMKNTKDVSSEIIKVAFRFTSEGKMDEAEKLIFALYLKWRNSGLNVDKKTYDKAKSSFDSVMYNEIFHGAVSNSLFASFGMPFLKKYGLKNLNSMQRIDRQVPTVYFGCYNPTDISNIIANKSNFKILVYGGTDATRKRILRETKKIRNLHHVAISKYIADDLDAMEIKYKEIAITPIDHAPLNIKPEPLGRSVYIYNCSKAKAKQYGSDLYEEVIKRIGKLNKDIKFEVCGHKTHSREGLMEVYKRSFIGLRLLEHDGLPNTVIELGLMGRRTIHNGGLPSGIPYSNVDDICNSIIKEFKKVGKTQYRVAKSTLEHLENSREWLKRSYWDKS